MNEKTTLIAGMMAVVMLGLAMFPLAAVDAEEAADGAEEPFPPFYVDLPEDIGELPSRYDLRDEYYVTPVRNQGAFGNCWAYASMAATETTMVRAGYGTEHLSIYGIMHAMFTGEGMERLGDGNELREVKSDPRYSGCFNQYVAEALLLYGPEFEKDTPDLEEEGREFQYIYDYRPDSAFRVTEITALPLADHRDEIKWMLNQGLGGFVTVAASGIATHEGVITMNDPDAMADHSVAIVGYDDDFPKEAFEKPASSDGAWLVKNSWGEYKGTDGYIWMSYENTVDTQIYFVTGLEPVDGSSRVDVSAYYSPFTLRFSLKEGEQWDWRICDVFTADRDLRVSAFTVMQIFALTGEHYTTYSAQIYINPKDPSDPTSGRPAMRTPQTGYITPGADRIELDEDVYVREGVKYSLVIEFADEDGEAWFDFYTYEYNEDAGIITDPLIVHGRSYKSIGGEWIDLEDEGGWAMAVYTVDSVIPTATVFPVMWIVFAAVIGGAVVVTALAPIGKR